MNIGIVGAGVHRSGGRAARDRAWAPSHHQQRAGPSHAAQHRRFARVWRRHRRASRRVRGSAAAGGPFLDDTRPRSRPFAGTIVMDATNYYPFRDKAHAALDAGTTTTSAIVAAQLPDARIVKVWNAIMERDILPDARPAGAVDRRALPIAGDDVATRQRFCPSSTASASTRSMRDRSQGAGASNARSRPIAVGSTAPA